MGRFPLRSSKSLISERTPLQMSLSEHIDDLEQLAIRAAREDLLAFIMLMDPNFTVGPHHRVICDALMDLESGKRKRVMVFLAPRSSKSLITSVYFPAWAYGRHASWQVISASHSASLATKFGRQVRDIIESPQYQAIFKTRVKKDTRAADDWQTTANGMYYAVGTGGAIAGHGAHLAIVDDPISEQDAYSQAKREEVNQWYPGGLRSRLMPGGRVAIVQTRWHPRDLSGVILDAMEKESRADQFYVIKIPALVDEPTCDLLNEARDKLISQGYLPEDYPVYEPGMSFFPAGAVREDEAAVGKVPYYWDTEELLSTKANTPPLQWSALYMQSPTAEEGNIIKAEWWQDWDKPNLPEIHSVVQSYDTAFSISTTADFTAVTTWGLFYDDNEDPCLLLMAGEKSRWEYPLLRKRAIDLYKEYEPDCLLVEKKASGQSLIQDLRMAGLPVIQYTPDRDKVSRAHAVSDLFFCGRIYKPGWVRWTDEIVAECANFPNVAHDDYVDSITQVLLWFKNGGWVANLDDINALRQREDMVYNRPRRRYYN